MKAATWWRDGVKQCEKMYKELGSPRVYLFFDTQHMVFAPMTYEPNKQLRPALKQLSQGEERGGCQGNVFLLHTVEMGRQGVPGA